MGGTVAEVGIDSRLVLAAPRENGVLELQKIGAPFGEGWRTLTVERFTLSGESGQQTGLVPHDRGIGIHSSLQGLA